MFFDYSKYSYYIQPGATDMRRGEKALVRMIQEELKLDPFSRCMYMFCSCSLRIIRVVVWDGNGFWVMTKSLQKGQFAWPGNETEACRIKLSEVKMLLSGADIFRRIPALKNGLKF